MAKSTKRSRSNRSKATGVEPFEAEDINDESLDDGEDDVEMAANKARKKRAEEDEIEDEAEVEDEDDEDEDEPTDEADEEDDDEDEDDEEEDEPVDMGFAPFIIHEDAQWELEDVIDEAEDGQAIYFFRPPSDDSPKARWYKLTPIEVGETGEVTPAS